MPIYVEVLGMNIGALALLRALSKSLDFIVAFAVGFAADQTRTPFGRRLPYIFFGSISVPIAMWALASPPPSLNLNADIADAAGAGRALHATRGLKSFAPFEETCADLAPATLDALYPLEGAHNCSALLRCLAGAIAAHELPEWRHARAPSLACPMEQRELGLRVDGCAALRSSAVRWACRPC